MMLMVSEIQGTEGVLPVALWAKPGHVEKGFAWGTWVAVQAPLPVRKGIALEKGLRCQGPILGLRCPPQMPGCMVPHLLPLKMTPTTR